MNQSEQDLTVAIWGILARGDPDDPSVTRAAQEAVNAYGHKNYSMWNLVKELHTTTYHPALISRHGIRKILNRHYPKPEVDDAIYILSGRQ